MNHHEEGILYDGMVNPSANQGVEVHSILDEAELVPNQGVEVHSILDEAELVPNGPFLEEEPINPEDEQMLIAAINKATSDFLCAICHKNNIENNLLSERE